MVRSRCARIFKKEHPTYPHQCQYCDKVLWWNLPVFTVDWYRDFNVSSICSDMRILSTLDSTGWSARFAQPPLPVHFECKSDFNIFYYREEEIPKHFKVIHNHQFRGMALLRYCSKCARIVLRLGSARACDCSPDHEPMPAREYQWRVRAHLGFNRGNRVSRRCFWRQQTNNQMGLIFNATGQYVTV